LRIIDGDVNWRIVYRFDPEEILVLDVFAKKTRATPADVIDICKQRLRRWDAERG
jgi:phage-related protein